MELSFNKEYEGKEENCFICYDNFPTSELYHMGCYHSFCHDCWQGYIDSKLEEISEKVNIICPGANCSSFLRKDFILQHSSTIAKEKWEKLIKEKEIKEVSNLVELFTTNSTSNGYYTKSTTNTDYFHYECLSEYDTGWGCAYRCLQMLLNNLKKRSIGSLTPSFTEPSIFEIQKQLTNVNTEGYFKISDIGTNRWIGPYEISPYLFELFGVTSEVGNEVIDPNGNNLDTIKRFWNYFEGGEDQKKTPSLVVIDNGIKTKNILGIRRKSSGESDEELAESEVLLFDPHYSENISFDDYKLFLEKGSTDEISVTSGDEEELMRKRIMVELSVLWIPFSAVFESELYQVLWVHS